MTSPNDGLPHPKLTEERLARSAIVYVRQSSEHQVKHNTESQRMQYALSERASRLGFRRVEVIDEDLGSSATMGAPNRRGFERLLAAVALGGVGLVLSRELSRLSRTDTDWCRLLELCQIFGTLIGDADQLYDLNLLDDQLVLGIKGTLSVVELRVLRQRLYEGMLNKARRGALYRIVAPGYVRGADGTLVKDPDVRVQDAIALVFRKFRETGSARQAFRWFRDCEVELPVNKSRGGRHVIVFQLPRLCFVTGIIRNPIYAGAYVYGRRPTEKVVVDGRVKRRQRGIVAPELAQVFIRDHHESYIDWASYENNQRMLRDNSKQRGGDDSVGPARSGQGLLTGLLRCGRCGRKLHVRYWGKSGTAARYLCSGDYEAGGRYCLGFGGSTVDRRFCKELLAVISPLGLQASFEAITRLENVDDERRGALSRQLQQAEYEALRAGEQYDEVDPRHRLVAVELERRYNDKLQQVQAVQAALTELDDQRSPLSAQDCSRLQALGRHFGDVWDSPACSPELKKRIVRTVVEEILVDEKPESTLDFVVHWKGGAHTHFVMPKPPSGVGRPTAVDDLEVIRQMAIRYGDEQIARVLNKLGRTTAKGNRWNQTRVATARRNHGIAGQRRAEPNPDLFTLNSAARHLGVSDTTIRRLVEAKVLPYEQLVPWAPWEIRRQDLEGKPIQHIVEHLHRTGRLLLQGNVSSEQQALFE